MALNYLGRLARARQLPAGGNSNTETAVLKAGEAGFVTDTGDLRVGDGTTAFSALKSVRNHRRVRTVTATGAVEINDEVLIVNNAGATTQTLPSAVTNSGRVIVLKNIGAGTVTVAASAGTVEDTSLAANESATYLSNGTNWYVV